jgi:hypothetical protein
MSIITKIEEFVASKPDQKPSPGVAPTKPKPQTPSPAPSKPSPIPTKKPSIEPVPKMKAEDVVDVFMTTLRKVKAKMPINFSKLKQKYD